MQTAGRDSGKSAPDSSSSFKILDPFRRSDFDDRIDIATGTKDGDRSVVNDPRGLGGRDRESPLPVIGHQSRIADLHLAGLAVVDNIVGYERDRSFDRGPAWYKENREVLRPVVVFRGGRPA